MLRRIRLKNFVHFLQEQSLEFDEGSYFCIGQNGSGKSAFFEAIRRCMSTSKNMGMSSSHDPEIPSVAMCYFNDAATKRKKTNGQQTGKSDLVSIIMHIPQCGSNTSFKLVFVRKTNTIQMDRINLKQETFLCNTEQMINNDARNGLLNILSEEMFSIDTFLEAFERALLDTDGESTKYNDDTECEKVLRTIDESLVITYPMRSIAPVQWTNSAKLSPTKAPDAKREVQERAEILSWYFNKIDKSEEYERLVMTYYNKITDNCTAYFKKCGEKICAFETRDSTNKLGIEKIPEGYYEAMNCSIILAYPDFKTVCLEEPGRGMHPQMVERLRDLILKPLTDKIVLVTSHKPAFVAAWNIPNTFFFKKIRPKQDVVGLDIIEGSLLSKDTNEEGETNAKRMRTVPEKTIRFTTTRHFTTLYFARRVLLVEGGSDILFMTELKAFLLGLDSKPLLESVFKRLLRENSKPENIESSIDAFNRFLWPLHILGLDGEPNKEKLEKVCKTLEIERYYLLDYDAIVDEPENKTQKEKKRKRRKTNTKFCFKEDSPNSTEDTFYKFLEQFKPSYKDSMGNNVRITEQNIREDVGCLEKSGIFVWKKQVVSNKGTIETAIKELNKMIPAHKIQNFLVDNNVKLQWNDTGSEKHRNKLFVDKQLTDDNIQKVVAKVLMSCKEEENSQIFRLLEFLCKIYLQQGGLFPLHTFENASQAKEDAETVYTRTWKRI